MASVGEVVAGRYRLVRPLASSGMSRIWLATDETANRIGTTYGHSGEPRQTPQPAPIVLKHCAIPQGLPADQHELLRRWALPEAVAAARVRHPHVIHTLDVLPSWDGPWLVMEFLQSRTLAQVVDESGPLPVARVAALGLALLSGLAAAGRAGVMHLDVKPGNVLITTDGRAVLTDFSPAVTPAGVRALAESGIVLGSPKWIAPERIFDHVTDERADLWSLGATLYHAVEGRPPFPRATTSQILKALADPHPAPPRRAGPLAPVLSGLLRRDPAGRMTAAEVERHLRAIVEAGRRRPRTAARRRIPVFAAALAVVATLTTVAATAEGMTRSGTTEAPGSAPASAAAATSPSGPAKATSGPAGSTSGQDGSTSRQADSTSGQAGAGAGAGVPDSGEAGSTPGPGSFTAGRAGSTPGPRNFEGAESAPKGYLWWTDSSGYRVAIPEGWRREPAEAGGLTFHARRGRTALGITPLAEPPVDALASLAVAESTVGLAGYRRVRVQELPEPATAVWEYTFQDIDGTAMRALQRLTTSDGHGYLIEWRTASQAWPAELSRFTTILATFTPGP